MSLPGRARPSLMVIAACLSWQDACGEFSADTRPSHGSRARMQAAIVQPARAESGRQGAAGSASTVGEAPGAHDAARHAQHARTGTGMQEGASSAEPAGRAEVTSKAASRAQHASVETGVQMAASHAELAAAEVHGRATTSHSKLAGVEMGVQQAASIATPIEAGAGAQAGAPAAAPMGGLEDSQSGAPCCRRSHACWAPPQAAPALPASPSQALLELPHVAAPPPPAEHSQVHLKPLQAAPAPPASASQTCLAAALPAASYAKAQNVRPSAASAPPVSLPECSGLPNGRRADSNAHNGRGGSGGGGGDGSGQRVEHFVNGSGGRGGCGASEWHRRTAHRACTEETRALRAEGAPAAWTDQCCSGVCLRCFQRVLEHVWRGIFHITNKNFER